MQRIKFTAP